VPSDAARRLNHVKLGFRRSKTARNTGVEGGASGPTSRVIIPPTRVRPPLASHRVWPVS